MGKPKPDDGWECPRCPYSHEPGSLCPPPGRWLVLDRCPTCNPDTERYCGMHQEPSWRARTSRRAPTVARPPRGFPAAAGEETRLACVYCTDSWPAPAGGPAAIARSFNEHEREKHPTGT